MKKLFGKSGIYIKPENKGKFTKWAKSKDMSVQEAANTVMANPEEYSSTIVKRANFAKNAAKWKHANGGYVNTDPPVTNTLDPNKVYRVPSLDTDRELAFRNISYNEKGEPITTDKTLSRFAPYMPIQSYYSNEMANYQKQGLYELGENERYQKIMQDLKTRYPVMSKDTLDKIGTFYTNRNFQGNVYGTGIINENPAVNSFGALDMLYNIEKDKYLEQQAANMRSQVENNLFGKPLKWATGSITSDNQMGLKSEKPQGKSGMEVNNDCPPGMIKNNKGECVLDMKSDMIKLTGADNKVMKPLTFYNDDPVGIQRAKMYADSSALHKNTLMNIEAMNKDFSRSKAFSNNTWSGFFKNSLGSNIENLKNFYYQTEKERPKSTDLNTFEQIKSKVYNRINPLIEAKKQIEVNDVVTSAFNKHCADSPKSKWCTDIYYKPVQPINLIPRPNKNAATSKKTLPTTYKKQDVSVPELTKEEINNLYQRIDNPLSNTLYAKPVLPEPPKQKSNEIEITKENMKYSPEDMLLLENYKGLVLQHPNQDINLDKNLDEKLRRIKSGSKFVPDYIPLEPGYQMKPSEEDFNKMKIDENYRQEYYDKAMGTYLGKDWKTKLKKSKEYSPTVKMKFGGKLYKEGGYLKDEDTYITKEGKSTKRGLWANVYLKKKREGKLDMGEGGGIPDRYKEMGFSRVGQKKDSSRPGKKWMVLAKKDDDYKVVHGGYTGMQDYSQHGSEKRKENFWNRMGGKDSSKAKDPFSPLYWHKRIGTWAEGGKVEDDGEQVDVEIEAEELVLRPQEDGSYEIVTETSEDAPTHEEGGVDITLQEGDLVFPKKYIAKVKKALAKGEETGDYSDVDKLSEQMQKSAYKAYKDGKPYSSGGYNEELENQENQEKMEAKNGMKCKGGCKMGSGGKCMKCGGKMHKEGGMAYKYGGKFPDLTGDNKVTKADVLKGRGVFKKGGKAMKSCCMKSGGAVCKVCGMKKMSFGGALKK